MFKKIKEDYRIKRKMEEHNMINHELKLIIRALILLIIAIIYGVNLNKCLKIKNENEVLTNLTKKIALSSSNNTNFTLGIRFCSCFYEDGFFLIHPTWYYWSCILSIYIYFSLELTLIYRHLLVYFIHELLKKGFGKLKLFFFKIIAGTILTLHCFFTIQLIVSIYFYVISFLFQILNYFFLNDISFIWPSFFINTLDYKSSIFDKNSVLEKYSLFNIRKEMSLMIHSSSFIVMYALQKRLQMCGLLGVIVIKHTSKFKKIVKYGIISRLFFWPLRDTINKSSLWVYYGNITKLSDLNSYTKKLFIDELNTFVYEESLFNELFCWFIYSYFLFFFIVLVLYILEKNKLNEAEDLHLAKIKQHLIKYYWDLPWWSKPLSVFYKLYNQMFGKSKVEIALEKIRRKWEFDQLNGI
jgi:hypothetical protein